MPEVKPKMDDLHAPGASFKLEEATITELHHAIRSGQTTCVTVVQQYIDRVQAYNGVASMLVTSDGAPIPEVTGATRGKTLLRFPTQTVRASTILPISTDMRERRWNFDTSISHGTLTGLTPSCLNCSHFLTADMMIRSIISQFLNWSARRNSLDAATQVGLAPKVRDGTQIY